jgi:Reverse transcriptase (RNA-dependent DNA polymerase)
LCQAIREWIAAGDQIVVLVDANEDVRKDGSSNGLRNLGLVELGTERYGDDAPATHDRGSRPIDGIFVSPTLAGADAGYVKPPCGDHLCVWADIPMSAALGHNPPSPIQAAARRLKTEDPRVVAKYVEALLAWYRQENLAERIEALHASVDLEMSESQKQEWEAIDEIVATARVKAESTCRHLHMGAIQWTPEYGELWKKESFWKLFVNWLSGRKVNSRRIRRAAEREGMTGELVSTNLTEAQEQLAKVKAKIKEHKENHVEWLELLAKARADARLGVQPEEDDDHDFEEAERRCKARETELKALLRREEQQWSARIIRAAHGKLGERSGLTKVIGPIAGIQQERTDKEGMEHILLEDIQRRYNQAANTLFLQEPLAPLIGPVADTEAAQAILEGTFVPPEGTNPGAVKLIKQMKRPEGLPSIKMEVEIQRYRRAWLRCRQQTAAASELHFGHFRAQATNDILGRCDALMAHIPYRTGYTPIRWQEGRGVMLLKEAGNYNAEKMRTILLLPPDFNFNNKLFGRQLMYHAEQHGLIAPEQYGTRKNLSAIEHCVNKRLTFDLIRQEKRPAVLCSNDAKGCYDRIVHSVASLCMQQLGMPIQPIVSMFSTLQQMRHHIRTAYGDSESYFRANQVNPIAIQGVGQGNGAGPQIWAVVSTVVLNLLREEGNGGYFKCPITGNEFFFVGYSFVDDTDLVVTTRRAEESFESVLDGMQQALSDWEAGLRATGGAIEPWKTFWYGMDFEWKGSEWRYRKKQDFGRVLQVQNPDSVIEPLECVDVSEARRTLGVRLAPDGSNKEELRYLLKQAHLWASTIVSGHLGKKLSLQSFMTTLCPKIRYPLAATTFTRDEAAEIDKVLVPTVLSQSGVNRNFPRDLVFGSTEMGGLGFTEVYTEQGIEGIVRLAQYGRCRQHTVGKLLRASWAPVELGCRESIFCLNYTKLGKLLTECSIKTTRRFTVEEQITIKVPQAQFEDLRQEDRLLIPNVSGEVLQVVNRCRLYLRVVSLAEIVTPDGLYITANAWLGIRGDRMRTLSWPEQA